MRVCRTAFRARAPSPGPGNSVRHRVIVLRATATAVTIPSVWSFKQVTTSSQLSKRSQQQQHDLIPATTATRSIPHRPPHGSKSTAARSRRHRCHRTQPTTRHPHYRRTNERAPPAQHRPRRSAQETTTCATTTAATTQHYKKKRNEPETNQTRNKHRSPLEADRYPRSRTASSSSLYSK